MRSDQEMRAATLTAEVRKAAKPDDTPVLDFTGHAAVFDQRTWIGPPKWGFWEKVDKRFFDDVLDGDTAFLVNHDSNIVLARTTPGTLTLATDPTGLRSDAQFDPADPDAVKWAGRVQRGDVSTMSFQWIGTEDSWEVDETTGEETRTLLSTKNLVDVSLTTFGAYEGTDAGMRAKETRGAREAVLRHRGAGADGEPLPNRERIALPSLTGQRARELDLKRRATGLIVPS